MIEVELPNGAIIEFPDGTAPDVMKSVAAKASGKQDYRGDGLAGTRVGAVVTGLAQGVSLGTAEEGKAAIKAGLDWMGNPFVLGDGEPFGDSYDRHLTQERNVLAQMREENPVATYGGEALGSLVLPGAGLKAGASLGSNALRMGLSGAGAGTAYGFGAGEGGAASRARSAAVGGLVGGAVGAAAPFALRGVQNALDSRATRRAITEAADAAPEPASLARQSGALYEKARQSGVVVKGDALRPLLDDLGGMERLDADFTPDALKVIGRLTSKLEAGDLPLGELEALHRRAGLAVTKNRIANPADAGAAGAVAQRVDEFMMSLPDDAIASNVAGKDEAIETFRQARTLWKQFRKSEKLQEVIANAELKDNPALAIKQGFRAILSNKNKRATFSPAEIQVMRQVVSDTRAGSWVQRLIGYGTGLSRQVAATTTGYGLGGPVGAAVGSMVATKVGSMAKDAASDAALDAGRRAAGFVAGGGRYAQPAPYMLPGAGNALRHLPAPAAAGAVNLWNQ